MPLLQRLFPALVEPTLRRYLSGQVVSVLGSWTQNVTLNLVVYHLSGSAAVLALLNFLLYGPQILVAPLAGARVTSGNARGTTLVVLYLALAVAASLALLALLGRLTLPVILGHALAIGLLTAVEAPARQVLMVSSLRDRDLLPQAVAMNTMVYNVGRMVGPSVAAIVYPTLGPSAAFALCGVALLFMAWCVRKMRVRTHYGRGQSDPAGLRAGLTYILDDRFTARALSILVFLGLLGGSYQTLVPLLADHVFHHAATYTGVFFACAGLGALAAAVVLSSSAGGAATERLLGVMPWTACAALAALALSGRVVVSGTAFAVLGFSLSFVATSSNAAIQRRCPDAVRGALVGMYGMAYNGTMPFGYLLAGTLSEALTVTGAFGTQAVVLALALGSLMYLFRERAGVRSPPS